MSDQWIETARGAHVHVTEYGAPDAPAVLFLHGLAGPVGETRFLELLSGKYRVVAPELPGYGQSQDEELFEDMLDFTLHGWDIVVALGLIDQRPALIGHSLGGMIAAEMAAIAPRLLRKLVLVDPLGVWLDEHPIPDAFSFLPYEFGEYLFHDPSRASALLPGTDDIAEPDTLRDFFVDNSRRLGTAGKMLFPVPNRRLSKRLYRMSAETLLVWGAEDRFVPPVYADRWTSLLPRSRLQLIPNAGHMLPYEQPDALAQAVTPFLA